jgi:aminopeptidase N
MPEVSLNEDVEVQVESVASLSDGDGLGIHWDGETLFSFHEPQGARLWMVVYDDPADKATLEWHIGVDSSLVVAANGELKGKVDRGDGLTTWNYSFDELIPTYLMVVHASNYVVLEDETRDGKPIRHHVHPGDEGPAWVVFERTPEILEYFSELYGDFPWASYGHAVAPFGGAMEHTTMTTFGDGLLGRAYGELVNAHEVAHHWFGDYVTLADWPEIWLNEGFASYGEVLWYEQDNGALGRRRYVESQVESYFNWQQYEGLSSVYDPNYLFGGAVYDKGSVVLDMLRSLLGDDAFFEAVALYVDRYAHSNATTSDLEEVFSEVYGSELSWFFEQWVYRAGDPALSVGWTKSGLGDGLYQLNMVVRQDTADLWRLPLQVQWRQDGQVRLEELWIEEREQIFSFCVSGSSESLNVDPDGLLLLEDVDLVAGPTDVPVVCDGPGSSDTGLAPSPYGYGEESVSVGGCSKAPLGSPQFGWLGLMGLVLLGRRSRHSPR